MFIPIVKTLLKRGDDEEEKQAGEEDPNEKYYMYGGIGGGVLILLLIMVWTVYQNKKVTGRKLYSPKPLIEAFTCFRGRVEEKYQDERVQKYIGRGRDFVTEHRGGGGKKNPETD